MPSVGVVIVTHNANNILRTCVDPLFYSLVKPKILIMNSSSNDGTVELAQEMGLEVLLIPRSEFNHGLSREKARKHLGTDIVVMMTPDAIGMHPNFLEKLIAPIIQGDASISYARQIPHDGADPLETFPRLFNYPPYSNIRSREQTGVYTIFCSNSCAAYNSKALDEIGGFAETLLGEDTIAAAKLLQKGHKIAYVADAVVKHSHSYTLLQEFKRSFDTGLARKINRKLIAPFGRDTKRGFSFYFSLVQYLWKNNPLLIPYATLQTAVKLLGYYAGRYAVHAPLAVKRKLSSQDFYWHIN